MGDEPVAGGGVPPEDQPAERVAVGSLEAAGVGSLELAGAVELAGSIGPAELAESAELAALADLAEAVLSVARRLALASGRASDTVPLRPLEALLMRHIDQHPGTTPSRLAAHLGLRSSNASAALRDLEAKGFIERTVDPVDGRSVRVGPTPLAAENRVRIRRAWAGILAPAVPTGGDLSAGLALMAALDAAFDGGGRSPEPGRSAGYGSLQRERSEPGPSEARAGKGES